MALAAEDFEELISGMGLAGTAAADLEGILARLAAQTEAAAAAARANAAAEKVAAATGTTAAAVKKALAAANAEAAAAAKAAAAAEKAAAAEQATAAREAAAAAKQAAAERKAADKAIMAESLRMMGVRDERMAHEQKAAAAAAEKAAAEAAAAAATRQNAAASRAAAVDTFAMTAATQGLTAAMGPYGQAAEIVIDRITFLASKLRDMVAAAIQFTQEDDALRSTLGALAGGGDSAGQAVMDLIDGLADLPFAAGSLEGWAKSLLAAGMQTEQLDTALRAVAASTAIMGDQGTGATLKLLKQLQGLQETGGKVELDKKFIRDLQQAGVSLDDIAKQLGVSTEKLKTMTLSAEQVGDAMQQALIQKGVGPLQRMGQTFASMRAKVVDAFEDAFSNLGDIVGPFMAELQSLASEFFKGSVASTGFSGVVRGVLTPVFQAATSAVRGMHIALLYVEIGYLKAAIALRPVTEALDKLGGVGAAVKVVLYMLAAGAVLAAVAMIPLVLAVAAVALPFVLAAAAIVLFLMAVSKVGSLISGAIANFDNLSNAALGALSGLATGAAQAAAGFVAGLVDGITSGAGAVAAAVANLAQGALNSFTSFFGIASPSKLMKKHARDNIAIGGVAGGLDEGADEVDRAMTNLVEPPEAGGRGGRRGGRWSKLADKIEIVFRGRAEEFPEFREQADNWLEELADSGPEPEAA